MMLLTYCTWNQDILTLWLSSIVGLQEIYLATAVPNCTTYRTNTGYEVQNIHSKHILLIKAQMKHRWGLDIHQI